MKMKKILIGWIILLVSLSTNAQNKKVTNFHQRFTFNVIGYNDYDLGTSSTMSYSNSVVKVDVDNEGTGTLLTYINGEKVFYFINQCDREPNNGTISFELIDKEDMKPPNTTVTTVGGYLIIKNNNLQAFKIFIKGKNEAIILMNR